jgi:hypothetical protein
MAAREHDQAGCRDCRAADGREMPRHHLHIVLPSMVLVLQPSGRLK